MKTKLKNIKPFFISLVSKRNRPVNSRARIAFVKAKEKKR